ncbi:MAG: SDR family NAD(P)-dependent oxidoreductase [Gammaproteobacteria bacterium]
MSKVVLITGASRGVGAATALVFSKFGFDVVLNCSSTKVDAELIAKECSLNGVRTLVIESDISEEENCRSLIEETIQSFGQLDVLVNNAARTKFAFNHADMAALDTNDFVNIYKTNLVAPYNLIKFSLNYLSVSEIRAVVNVASMAGINAIGSSVAYAASKAALINMTLSLARALGPIKVNAVCPGFIEGDWLKKGLGDEIYKATRESIMKNNPLGKVCKPIDVANAIYYLACGQDITTGETLILDGGSFLGGNPLK